MKYVPKELPEGVNAPHTNALAELGLLAGALVTLVIVAFYALGLASDWLAVRMSPALEAAIGERLPLRDLGVEVGGREREILDALLAHVPHEGHDVQLRVLCERRNANAVALPGGRVVVWGGLLTTVESENELAWVLAHELGHFHHRDHLRALGRGLVLMALVSAVGASSDFTSSLLMGSGVAVGQRFNQRQELAADRFAAEVIQQTYGHVGGITNFFGHPALRDGGSWFGTHPASQKRVRALTRLARERGWRTAAVTPYMRTPSLCPD